MKGIILFTLTIFSLLTCTSSESIEDFGLHYQKHHDYFSLDRVLNMMPQDVNATYVKKILGEPIDMGFDYRYLLDSVGVNGCPLGVVFHLNEDKKVDDLWLGEICE